MRNILIIILLLSLFVTHSQGNTSKRTFDLMDSKKGLSSGLVFNILRDRQGFMWFATVNGLVKYDGYEWTTYRKQLLHPRIPQTQIVISLHEDRQGMLWLGTRNALIRFDRSRNEFRHFHVKVPGSPISFFSQIGQIREDPTNENILWLKVLENLVRFNKSTERLTYFGVPGDQSKLKDFGQIIQFDLDPKGHIWCTTRLGLFKYDPVNDKFLSIERKNYTPPSPAFVISLSKSSRDPNVFWMGYMGAIERYNTNTGESTVYTLPLGKQKPPVTMVLESVTNSDILLIGTWGQGLLEYNLKTNDLQSFRYDGNDPDSLVNDTIISMHQGECGTVWICTFGGLNRMEERKNRIETYNVRPENKNGYSFRFIYYINESSQNPDQIRIGTSDGLSLYDRKKNEFQTIDFGASGLTGPNFITNGLESASFPDTLWLTSIGGGLFKLNTSDKTRKQYIPANDKGSSSLGSRFLLSIHEWKKQHGCLWIGTMDKGLDFFDTRNGTFRHYIHDESNPNTISYGPVVCFLESPETPGMLWIGTMGGGLNKFNTETETFTRFEHDATNPAGLADNIICSIYESRREPGILWIGSAEGLNRFDMKKEVFTDYLGRTWLKNFTINDVVEDKSGNLWLATFQGLLKYNSREGVILHMDVRDGLVSNELIHLYISKRNELYIGTMNGMNVFHYEDIRRNTTVPPVVITDFTLHNQSEEPGQSLTATSTVPVVAGAGNSVDGDTGNCINLSYQDRVFSFQFAALNYYNSEKNQYAYKMEGFDDDWIHVGHRRTAMFTGLPPGEYRFRVKGANNDGVWNDTGASVKVIIAGPWWKTTWAYGIYGLLVLLLFITANRIQRRLLVRKERNLAIIREADWRAKAAEAQARAMEVENRRKTEELEKARDLQLSMLPQEVPNIPGKEIGAYMQTAAEVGGDYYDFLTTTKGKLMIAFGDATGHGLNAGTMVSIIKGILTSSQPGDDLPGFFTTCTYTMKRMRLGNLFMGLILLVEQEDHWSVISAGMPPIYVYRSNSGEVETYFQKSPPLGAFSKYTHTSRSIRLEKGDTLLLFSDGLPELFNEQGEMFGFESVKDCFGRAAGAGETPRQITHSLRDVGEKWRQAEPQADDMTFVVMKITG